MRFKKQLTFLIVLSIILLNVFVVGNQTETESSPYDLIISGLVDRPLNFTYSELQSFPMVSEVALMKCVGGWTQLYNWTGIPLFFLLTRTGVKAGATEVVFYASDGFSSSLTIERALHPTTILALQANGTVLSHADGYPYRLVVPCKYGYKWVKWITEIEVVDYDYKGTWESRGFSDEAGIPSCTLPSTTPPFENIHIVLGNTTHIIITLSNSTISSFHFDVLRERIYFKVTGPSSTTGYCCVTIPKELLWCDSPEQWQVWVNNTLIEDRKVMEDTKYTYIYFTYDHSIQEVQIKGINVIPDEIPPTTFDDYDDLWHNEDFYINLTATDNISGVAETYYKTNEGSTQNVSVSGQPFITTEDANNTLEYWSVDNAGNEEIPYKTLNEIKLDKTAPTIGVPSRTPDDDILPEQEVKVSVSVTDALSGVKNVTLSYTINDGATWANLPMNYNASTTLYEATIPKHRAGTWVKYKIVAQDSAENQATKDETEPYCTYQVIPEFPTWTSMLLILIVLTFATVIYKRRLLKTTKRGMRIG